MIFTESEAHAQKLTLKWFLDVFIGSYYAEVYMWQSIAPFRL